jgi:hypothetical protein
VIRRVLPALLCAALILSLPSSASAAIRIKRIYFDPPGSDTGSNINQEYVVIKNTGNRRKNLTGWRLRDPAGHVYTFPEFRLRPDRVVRIHTGDGNNDGNDLYWGSGWYIWNNDGDTARLRNRSGNLVDSCSYSDSDSSPAYC